MALAYHVRVEVRGDSRFGFEYAVNMPKELWFVGPNQVELRETLPGDVPAGWLRVAGLYSAVSHGTEGLLVTGQGPTQFDPSLDAPDQATYPRRYGYAWVGRVLTPGPTLGATVFSLQPHGTEHVLTPAQLRVVPPTLAPERATLAAAMETALNAVWDAELRVGERVVVLGAGTIGLLVSYVAARAGARVTVVEPRGDRHAAVKQCGVADVVPSADALPDDFDAVFEVTGDPRTLDAAIARCGLEARVVVVSFYGAKAAPVGLGDQFHRRRLRLVSSQVSTIPSGLRSRFDFARRFEVVCALLEDARLDVLTQHVVPFDEAEDVYARLGSLGAPPQVLFRY